MQIMCLQTEKNEYVTPVLGCVQLEKKHALNETMCVCVTLPKSIIRYSIHFYWEY